MPVPPKVASRKVRSSGGSSNTRGNRCCSSSNWMGATLRQGPVLLLWLTAVQLLRNSLLRLLHTGRQSRQQ